MNGSKETVEEIRKYSDRPILIRSHRHAILKLNN